MSLAIPLLWYLYVEIVLKMGLREAPAGHNIAYKTACAPSEDSDQPALMNSQRSTTSSCGQRRRCGSFATHIVSCEDSGQTARIRRLI